MKTPVRQRVRGRQTVVGISFNAALTDWARDLSRPNNPDDHFNQNYTYQLKLYIISTKTGCTNKLYLITQLNWFVFVNWQLFKQYNKQWPVDCTVYSVEYNKQHTHFWRRLPPWSPATKAALGLLELRYVPLFTTNSSSRSSSSSSSSSPSSPKSSPLQLSTASVIIALDSLTEFENQN